MSDTSLVFDLLGRDRVSRVLGVIRSSFQQAGRTAEESMRRADVSTERLDRQIQETEKHLEQLNREFAETGDKTLFGKMSRDRTLLTQLRRVRDEIGAVNNEAGRSGLSRWMDSFRDGSSRIGQVASSLGSLGSSAAGALGPLGMLAAAVAGVSAALFAVGPAVAVAGGALGSLPGIIAGGAAAFGTLKLGLFGLSSEYQRLTTATGGGGGGATGAAKDFTAQQRAVEAAVKAVTRAERDLRDAQKDALRAQQEINDARKEAADRMREQSLDLRDARISEGEAVDDLEAAERELAEAQGANDPERLEDAQRAYDRAALAVERAQMRTKELTEATEENTKKGVEGSEEVVAAKDREAQATRRVKDAEEQRAEAIQRVADARKALADAQAQGGGGGGGGGGQQITKLAPAAREFLNTILGLRPAFERLRLDVQQKLFAGLGDKVQLLADRWMPQLHKSLGGFATTFNGIASTFFDTASKPSFIEDMGAGLESVRKMIDRVGQAIAGPFLEAWGRLSRASGPFLEKLGTLIGRSLEKFSAWIAKADESGKLTRFFEGAADTLEKIWTVGEDIVEVMGKFIAIIYPDAKSGGDSVLVGAHVTLEKISAWLDRPENQQKIRDIINSVKDLVGWFGRAADKVGSWYTSASNTYNRIRHGGEVLLGWVRNLPGRISRAASGMWNGFRDSFRAALNWIIGKWNGLSFSLPSVSFLGQQIGGGRVGMPHVNYLAEGGIARARPGGHLAVIGEGGEDEVVAPLSKLSGLTRPSGPQRIDVTVKLDFGTSELGQLMAKTVRTQPAVAAEMGKYIKVRVTA
jgi:hypothetical protein